MVRSSRLVPRLAAVLLGLGLLGAVEAGLRLSGHFEAPVGGTTAPWDPAGARLRSDLDAQLSQTRVDGQPGLAVPVRLARGVMQAEQWTTRPPPGRLRVFALGGSATYGLPVQRQPARTFPGRTQAWLEARGHPAQVINLGGAGFGSAEVLRLAAQLVDQGAQAWVLYAGNNEYFRYALGRYEAERSRQKGAVLDGLRLVRALRSLLPAQPAPAPPLVDVAAEQRRIVAQALARDLVPPQARPRPDAQGRWHRHDPAQATVLANWQDRLRQLGALADQAGATLYVVRVPANLVAAPWLSLHDPDLSATQAAQVEAELTRAAQAAQGGDPFQTVAQAQAALELDPSYAAAWYWLGMGQLAQGEVEPARRSLENALRLDMDPGRPLPELGKITDRVLAEGDAQGIDLGPLLASARAGPLGRNLFVDTCHLRPEAYDAVGDAIARALEQGLADGRVHAPPD